jgi:hypothetical protein
MIESNKYLLPLEITEVALVANLQTSGPMFVNDATGSIDASSGMLLSARLIITAGIGSTSSPYHKLYGSLPIPELDEDLECYFFVGEMQQKPIIESPFSTGKGTFVFCIIVEAKRTKEFHPYLEGMEIILLEKINRINFEHSMAGEITDEIDSESRVVLKEIYEEINQMIKLSSKFRGGSLFDIGFLVSLPSDLSTLGKKLILEPKGSLEEEIIDTIALHQLLLAGLVKREVKEGKQWIIPI